MSVFKSPSSSIIYLRKLLFAVLLFISFSMTSQVGIGTTDPAATSALDIRSNSQGLLVPRMTTTQRTAITTPANSLLVFDTDEKSFFYYDSTKTQWIQLNSSFDKRDNFVLVKSAADLPAPVNGKITLVSNVLYEINGTITLSASIDLNNAAIRGLDAYQDVLSFPGGVVFKGNTGGRIRNVTLKGAQAFEITGPGRSSNSSLMLQNTVINGMTASVGSISGLGLYVGNIVQFLNNTKGITYSEIGNLLLSNQAWFGNNSGTYETFTSIFDMIGKLSGLYRQWRCNSNGCKLQSDCGGWNDFKHSVFGKYNRRLY